MAEPAELETRYRQWRSQNPSDATPLLDATQALLKTVVSRKLGNSATSQDIEDVCSEALLEVLARLDALQTGDASPIETFAGYVAGIGYHAVHDYFRRRHPERHKLKNRLRYALKPEYGFALWDAGDEGWFASLQSSQHAPTRSIPESLPSAVATAPLPDLAAEILRAARAPVPFEQLVDRIAQITGIHDRQVPLEDMPAPPTALTFDFAASWAPHLQRLWAVIAELPVPQRIALLLNLQGDHDDSPVTLFASLGVASIDDIAAMLQMPALEFAGLWNRLPLGDQEIADRLNLTRQQVINLRMAARKRLARNLPEVIKQLHEHLQ